TDAGTEEVIYDANRTERRGQAAWRRPRLPGHDYLLDRRVSCAHSRAQPAVAVTDVPQSIPERRLSVTAFDRIVIIFNPNSTGSAPEMAQELHDELTDRLPQMEVVLSPTEHAGHGRDLAREAAST